MYKYFILLTFISTVVATNTKVNTQPTAVGATSNEPWITDWQDVKATLHSKPNGTDYSKVEVCTKIAGQIKLQINVLDNDKKPHWVDVFVPANAKLDLKNSNCSEKIGELEQNHMTRPLLKSNISLIFYNEAFRLNIYFTNSTALGSAGWLQFAIYQVELIANLTEFPTIFPHDADFHSIGNGVHDRWWKWMGTVNQSSFQCAHTQTVTVQSDKMKFSIQNMAISALNEGCFNHEKDANKTYDPNMCDFDYEQDDALAVVIGTVQTGFVLLTLVIYLIYLKKRGPVKVPDWIIEPAMRNATVQPIDDVAYERKMSQVSNGAGPNSDPMPTKRRTLNGNDEGMKY